MQNNVPAFPSNWLTSILDKLTIHSIVCESCNSWPLSIDAILIRVSTVKRIGFNKFLFFSLSQTSHSKAGAVLNGNADKSSGIFGGLVEPETKPVKQLSAKEFEGVSFHFDFPALVLWKEVFYRLVRFPNSPL